jgi:hypothetical protein
MAKSPNRSIRASTEFWTLLDQFAAAQGVKPGPAFVAAARAWIERGEPGPIPGPVTPEIIDAPARPDPKKVLATAQASAAHIAKPKPRISERQREWRAAIRGLPVGQVERKPGSMLKAPKKGPKR